MIKRGVDLSPYTVVYSLRMGDDYGYYRCCLCGFLTDEDEIVWTGPLLTKGVCADCEQGGDDYPMKPTHYHEIWFQNPPERDWIFCCAFVSFRRAQSYARGAKRFHDAR